MQFLFVEDILSALHLQNPTLEILEANTNLYRTLLYQHRGEFEATTNRFGNIDRAHAEAKLRSVVQIARNSNTPILVTPEYSCPWEVVHSILTDPAIQPTEGKLWILGCESISPNGISEFQHAHNGNNDIVLHFENAVLDRPGNFLDPVCYIFKTRDQNQVIKTICLVQFKTQHMGVWTTSIERDNYVPGTQLYIFRNAPGSIHLFTLICSEALNFTQTDDRWGTTPYLILNIQLNPEPNHVEFRAFRRLIQSSDRKDLITLNWAQASNLTVTNVTTPLNNYPRSGFYTDAGEIDFASDNEFIHNHTLGLYYTYGKPKFHTFHLNGAKELFDVQNSKPFQGIGPLAFRRRTGPRMVRCYESLPSGAFQEITSADDGLLSFLDLRGCNNAVLRNPAMSPLDKERLICISAGDIEHKEDGIHWHRMDMIRLCRLNDDGFICRLTFTQDSEGHPSRTEHLEKLDVLNQIIQNPALIPEKMAFLRGNCSGAMFFRDGARFYYNFNLVTNDGANKATGAFCGRLSAGEAKRIFDKIVRLFQTDDNSRKRVIVWFKPNPNDIEWISDSVPPSITDDNSADPVSIKRQ